LQTASANSIENTKLHTFLGVISNFILIDNFKAPTLTNTLPTSTTENNISIEVQGKAGQKVYINSVFLGTIEANGTLMLTLDLSLEDNTFSLTLQDSHGNESQALIITIEW